MTTHTTCTDVLVVFSDGVEDLSNVLLLRVRHVKFGQILENAAETILIAAKVESMH